MLQRNAPRPETRRLRAPYLSHEALPAVRAAYLRSARQLLLARCTASVALLLGMGRREKRIPGREVLARSREPERFLLPHRAFVLDVCRLRTIVASRIWKLRLADGSLHRTWRGRFCCSCTQTPL